MFWVEVVKPVILFPGGPHYPPSYQKAGSTEDPKHVPYRGTKVCHTMIFLCYSSGGSPMCTERQYVFIARIRYRPKQLKRDCDRAFRNLGRGHKGSACLTDGRIVIQLRHVDELQPERVQRPQRSGILCSCRISAESNASRTACVASIAIVPSNAMLKTQLQRCSQSLTW